MYLNKQTLNQNNLGIIEPNANTSIRVSLTALKVCGFWAPLHLSGGPRLAYKCYSAVAFMFILGVYLIIQVVDMFQIWGDLPAMTGTAFLLFTNLAQTFKILNIVYNRDAIEMIIQSCDRSLRAAQDEESKEVVRRCNRETMRDQLVFLTFTTLVVAGWAGSAEEGDLPLRAWYPYNTKLSPAYELTYLHQICAIFIAAYLNVSKDTLVCSLIAQTKCRLQLLKLKLSKITEDLQRDSDKDVQMLLLPDWADLAARQRLRECVILHQTALANALHIESYFSATCFAQFSVSFVIICVSAFQMISQTSNVVRMISMTIYLLNMMFQVFLYCYHGNDLREKSAELVRSAYECAWYRCSPQFRSTLLLLMSRTFKPLRLTAGGWATLSLETFMAIIKVSYSFFTVLQQSHGGR